MNATLRRSFPLLATTFINRCGTIGMSLLPMLLVEKQFSSANSSLVMTSVKVSLLAGTYFGGWACDRLGMKLSLLISFLLAGMGLGLLPFGSSLMWIATWAVLAQLGQAIFYSPARVMVVELVPPENQQESIGWLKTANNLGNIFSYAFGAVFSFWGVAALMLFDSATSILAAGAGAWLLPNLDGHHAAKKAAGPAKGTWNTFLLCTLTVAAFFFFYELFMVSAAAKCRLLFGDGGLRLFSEAMVVNTALCTLFAVAAARVLHNPGVIFPLGIFLSALGSGLVAWTTESKAIIFIAISVITIGEIVFTALAQFVIIRATPATENQGSIYGISLVIQSGARILGAGMAFPMVVNNPNPLPFLAACGLVAMVLSVASRPNRVMAL